MSRSVYAVYACSPETTIFMVKMMIPYRLINHKWNFLPQAVVWGFVFFYRRGLLIVPIFGSMVLEQSEALRSSRETAAH